MAGNLPLVGAQAVILGMTAFNANARSVETQLAMISAATYRLERASHGSFGGVISAVKAWSAATQAASASAQKAIVAEQNSQTAAAVAIMQMNAAMAASAQATAAQQAAAQARVAVTNAAAGVSAQRLAAQNALLAAQQALQAAQSRQQALAQLAGVQAQQQAAAAAVQAAQQQVTAAQAQVTASRNVVSQTRQQAQAQYQVAQQAARNAQSIARAEQQAATAAAKNADAMQRASDRALQDSVAATAGIKTAWMGVAVAVAQAAAIVLTAMAAIGTAAVVMGQRYERALAFTGAVSESTAAQIAAVDAAQINLSRHSTQTATQLNSMNAELLKAGQSVEDLLGGVMQYTNALIVASNGELRAADAAILMQIGLKSFGLEAKDSEGVANAITAAVQRSTLTFGEFADATRQGGGAAANAGMSFQEFATTVGVLGLRLNSGSEAGTGLRMMLTRLQNPTKEATEMLNRYNVSLYDAQGRARPIRDLIANLTEAFGDQAVEAGKLTEQQRDHALAVIFSGRAVKTLLALVKGGVKDFDDMRKAVESLTVTDLANKLLLPTAAVLDIVKNNVTALGLAFNKGLDPYINKVASSLLAWLQSIDLQAIIDFADAVGSTLYNAFSNYGNYLSGTVMPVLDAYMIYQRAAVQVIKDFGAIVIDTGAEIAKAFMVMWNAVGSILNNLNTIIVHVQNSVQEAASSIANAVGSVIVNGFNFMLQSVIGVVNAFGKLVVESLPFGTKLAVETVLQLLSNLIRGFGSVDQAGAKLESGWSAAWSGIAGIAGRAVNWILSKLNQFIDGLASLPIIGEAIGGARAAIGGFLEAIPRFTANAGTAINNFATEAASAWNMLSTIKMPQWHDFAADVKKQWEASKDTREKIQKAMAAPVGETEPGEYPVDADDGAADKAAKAFEAARDRLAELLRDFNDDINDEVDDSLRKTEELYTKYFEQTAAAATEAQEEVNKIMQEAGAEIAGMYSQKQITDDVEARKKALDEQLEAAERARDVDRENAEVSYQHTQEDLQRNLDVQREMREKQLDDLLAAEARARTRTREDEDRIYAESQRARESDLERDQEAAERFAQQQNEQLERNLQNQQELRERELRARLDAQEEVLQKELDAEKRTLDASQAQRERALRAQFDAEDTIRKNARKTAEINAEDAEERAQAQAKYQEEVSKGVKESIARARLNEELKKIGEKTSERRSSQARDEKYDAEDTLAEQGQEARLLALRAEFETQDLALKAAHDKKEFDLRVAHEKQLVGLREQSEKDMLALRSKHEQDIDNLHAEHERQRRSLDDALDREARERERQREEEDRLFDEQQEATKRAFILQLDDEELARKRKEDEEERVRQRKLDEEDRKFHEEQEKQREALSKQIEQEDFNRRIENIETERDERIKAVEYALSEEQRKTRKKLSEDIDDLRGNLDERIDTIRTNYLDKLEDIAREGGAAIMPAVNEITSTIAAGLESVRDAAREATKALADMFGARNQLSDSSAEAGPRDWYGDYNYGLGSGMSEDDARTYADALQNNQYGGVVDAPYGQAVPIIAHGGERYEGIGAYNTALTAVRAAESMMRSGMGGSQQVNYNYEYNVNANYGRTQPEGSVRRDLAALVTLTRR